MKTIHLDNYTVFKGDRGVSQKFKTVLSKLIKENFSEPFNEANIKAILNFCLDHYAKEFESICRNETSSEFYRTIFWLHEQSVHLRMNNEALVKLNKEVGDEYFAIYRRVLKLILEEACLIDLVTEEINLSLKKRTEKVFDELFFLGDEMFSLATLLAEQSMIGDAVIMRFNDEGVYQLGRKREFELAFEHVVDMGSYKPNSFVIDKNAEEDFIAAVKDSFNLDYSSVMSLLFEAFEIQKTPDWDLATIKFPDIENAMQKALNVPQENIQSFLSGLYFKKEHKIPVKTVIRKPFSIDRFLNRPILIWKINSKEFCVFGRHSIFEAFNNLWLNAFPWNKAANEWTSNQSFKKFLTKKTQQNEKMLIDAVELEIKPTGLIYQPNLKNLVTDNGVINLENDQCGEIDFIVINIDTKKIFVKECKHLTGRYDMANFNMDFNSFTQGDSCFNNKIGKKVNWVTQNLHLIEQHFRNQKKLTTSLEGFTVEGIFIINTPTFYMYFSNFRIYVYSDVAKVLTGQYVDKTFTLFNDEEEFSETLFIKYPYFIKKKMIYYHDPYEDYPVDKYGYPIIPPNDKLPDELSS